MRFGKLGRKLAWATPSALKPMLDLVPDQLPDAESIPEHSPAIGEERGRVMIHLGCAAQVLRPDITSAAIRVLNLNGIAVHAPSRQQCCGALHWHVGDAAHAAKLANANMKAFGDGSEPIITTAAGCGSGMHEYPLILSGGNETASELSQHECLMSVFTWNEWALSPRLPLRRFALLITMHAISLMPRK
jgi:glycolate oxidase iron-sulfur subunit